jgi:hypothetical protein
MKKLKDKPYVSNYPPLDAWLKEHDGRCNWQLPLGDPDEPRGYVECWQVGKGLALIIVHAKQLGWELYTAPNTNRIDETLIDAALRLGFHKEEKP